MCTVTFIPGRGGYILGMNRDEKRSRAKGLPPRERRIRGQRVVHPSEPGGGTWIGLNDSGVTLALINWYSVSRRVTGKALSRGDIIPAISTAESPGLVDVALSSLPIRHTNPFRLIGIFPTSRTIVEWRWDLTKLERQEHRWQNQQWISSGFNEPIAQTIRSCTFERFQAQASSGTARWLKRLHSSHSPESGPFSTCMHRNDAATVSFTQIFVSPGKAMLQHVCGAPCETLKTTSHFLTLQRRPLRPGLLRNRTRAVQSTRLSSPT